MQDITMQKVRKFVQDAQRSFTASEEALMMRRKLPVEWERLPCSGVQFQSLRVYACPDMVLLMASVQNVHGVLTKVGREINSARCAQKTPQHFLQKRLPTVPALQKRCWPLPPVTLS